MEDTSSINDGSNIRVCVRVRPQNSNEGGGKGPRAVNVIDRTHLEVAATGFGHTGGTTNGRAFQFDLCTREDYSQKMVFEESGVRQLVHSAVEGYSVTVLAYGATGAGKTFTMFGDAPKQLSEPSNTIRDEDGVVPRAVYYMYKVLNRQPEEVQFSVRASNCEIYNEQVFDLLNADGKPLSVRYNIKRGFYVQGLLEVKCEGLADLLAVVEEGHRNRRVSGHARNADSSRSHSLFTMYLQAQWSDPDDGHTVKRYGKLIFVDLAGSERVKRSQAANVKETAEINKSLLTLGKVISALAAQAQRAFSKQTEGMDEWVPYRDSTLTKLLMDSLGGDAMTMMFACVSSALDQQDEILATLSYASRARNIANKPIMQLDPQEKLIASLRKEIELLKAENQYLRSQGGNSIPPGPIHTECTAAQKETCKLPQIKTALSRKDEGSVSNSNRSSPHKHRRRSSSNQNNGSPASQKSAPPSVSCGPKSFRVQRTARSEPAQVPEMAPNAQVQEVLAQYQAELKKMRKELNMALQGKQAAEQKQREAIAESENSARDLERIKRIFVFNNKDHNKDQDLDESDNLSDSECEDSKQAIHTENSRLKQLVRNLQEEIEQLMSSNRESADEEVDEEEDEEPSRSTSKGNHFNNLQREIMRLQRANAALEQKAELLRRRELDLVILVAKSGSKGSPNSKLPLKERNDRSVNQSRSSYGSDSH